MRTYILHIHELLYQSGEYFGIDPVTSRELDELMILISPSDVHFPVLYEGQLTESIDTWRYYSVFSNV